MATDPPSDLPLTTVKGEVRTLAEWVDNFHLGLVVVDPYTYESAWLLEEAARILATFSAADVRAGWVVTAEAADARAFLGPYADSLFTLVDPERTLVKALDLSELPAFVHIDMLGGVGGVAEGWRPTEWRAALTELATVLAWKAPDLPGPGAPSAFDGSPALG
jgi:hypothetical protein